MDVTYILIIFLIGALATFVSGDRFASKVALASSLVALVASLMLVIDYNANQPIGYSGVWATHPKLFLQFSGDGLSLAMLLLTTGLLPFIIISSFGNEYFRAKNFYTLMLIMACAMCGTFLATDGFLYYIFWEVALIPIYFIALVWGNDDPESRKKAVSKFFIYTFAGSLFMLVAFIYLYQKAGTFLLEDMLAVVLTKREQFWIFMAFFMAYAIKIPIIPFHTWQATVYEKAPTVGTMLLSGIMLKMGLYSIIRWQLPLAPLAAKDYMNILLGLSIAGVIYGSIVALRQKDLKRLLAYSSLAHVGLIAAGCYTLTPDGLSGAVMQMMAHGVVIVGLFFAAEIIARRYQTRAIADMGGIRTQTPIFSSMFMIFVLASVALPSTFNFVGEFMVLFSLSQINVGWAILGGLTIILGAFYMLRMYQQVMLGETNRREFADVTVAEGFAMIGLIGLLLFFGLYPKPLTDLIGPSINEIVVSINRYN
jgi:NADH-quinone oxidoreductase subunit M